MKTESKDRWRRGQVVFISPLLFFALLAILALTVDVGEMVVTRAHLQNAADAASLAAVQVLINERLDGTDEEEARALAQGEGIALAQENDVDAGVQVEFGHRDESGAFVATGVETSATAVRASVFRNDDAPGGPVTLAFARALGVDSADVSGSAVCEYAINIRGVTLGLSPFVIPEDRIIEIGQELVFYPAGDTPDPGVGDEMTVPGNWGLLNLDGGSCDTTELREWIANGYDGPLILNDDGFLWLQGTPGFRTALQQVIRNRIGDVLVMVIYDQVIDEGSTAQYRCVGFLVATILECTLTGNDPHVTCKIEEITDLHYILTGGGTPSMNIGKFQLVQ